VKPTSRLPDVPRRVLLFLDRELKGPITNILALSQTLASGRVTRASTREYARMAAFEAARLNRLVDEMTVLLGLDADETSPAGAPRQRAKKRALSSRRSPFDTRDSA